MHMEFSLSFSWQGQSLWDVQLWGVNFEKGSFGWLSGNKNGLEDVTWEGRDFSMPLSVKISLQTLGESI